MAHTIVPIWCCTFANNQFGEDFGLCIEDGPFYKAVMKAEGTILIVDRDAESLSRIWCGLELHLTIENGRAPQIYHFRNLGKFESSKKHFDVFGAF